MIDFSMGTHGLESHLDWMLKYKEADKGSVEVQTFSRLPLGRPAAWLVRTRSSRRNYLAGLRIQIDESTGRAHPERQSVVILERRLLPKPAPLAEITCPCHHDHDMIQVTLIWSLERSAEVFMVAILRNGVGQLTVVTGDVKPLSVCSSRPESKLHNRTAQSSPPEPTQNR